MANKSDHKTVAMRAVFTTEGNNEKSEYAIRQVMDVSKILGAPSLQDAIEYFQSQVPSIKKIEDFNCFIIDRELYCADFWE